MKEINIARSIAQLRKANALTQDDLAQYMGVTKASVSKWETAQSYPDIALLPRLASFFNISIDDLMGYEPQMSKAAIREQYHALSEDFASKPFGTVLARCTDITKRYYACFPLLHEMGILLVNYSDKAGDKTQIAAVLAQARDLFVRVKNCCGDASLSQQALAMEALCLLMLGEPERALPLLHTTELVQVATEPLLASAYQMTGDLKKAKSTLQLGIYRYMTSLLSFITSYLALLADDASQFEMAYARGQSLAEGFALHTLHPTTLMNFYLAGAQGYLSLGQREAALVNIQKYTDIAATIAYPLTLHGDAFFTLLDEHIADSALGAAPPRSEMAIRRSIVYAVELNPAFAPLASERRFTVLLDKLKRSQL